MAFIQITYIVVLTILRPFDRTENNLIEIINENIIFGMLIFLIWLSKGTDWTSFRTKVFNGIVFGNSIIITTVMMSKYSLFYSNT